MIREIMTSIRFEADMRAFVKCAQQVDHTRRILIIHRDHMLKSFARCEAVYAPELGGNDE